MISEPYREHSIAGDSLSGKLIGVPPLRRVTRTSIRNFTRNNI